jgi:anhydro-N-acetylmuramic acid kinase
MSNVTILPVNEPATGYDTGPGNVLMDGWIHRHQQRNYDYNGDWASTGTVNLNLLAELLKHPFFAKTAPKSTGREDFNLAWLDTAIGSTAIKPEDVQATLLDLTAISISTELSKFDYIDEIFICGGGAFNGAAMSRLEALVHPISLQSTDTAGVAPQWVEGCAFAWLAKQCLEGLPGNCPSVTGASKAVVLGTICPA